jgi:hypothetical protein
VQLLVLRTEQIRPDPRATASAPTLPDAAQQSLEVVKGDACLLLLLLLLLP